MTGKSLPIGLLALSLLALLLTPAASGGGMELAASCTSCHGIEGRGGGSIPALAGQSEDELLATLRALRQPDAAATIMPRLLRAYDDDELEALARYFAEVPQ